MPTPAKDILGVYHITHINNVQDILRDGVFSHNIAENRNPKPERIYDAGIVKQRKEKEYDGKLLGDFANFYFRARNPMLYRVHSKESQDVVVLHLLKDVMDTPNALISIGNAAVDASGIYYVKDGIKHLLHKSVWDKIHAEYWNDTDDGKRLIMSELLVPDRVLPNFIESIYVPTQEKVDSLNKMNLGVRVICEPNMFFLPTYKQLIARNVSLVDGDMFFSGMHTFTISVNTKGVMGKGLASRAKYQFPDVYVEYQDACRKKKLSPERPFLYKREKSMDTELSDAPEHIKNPNDSRWFLLFATKRDWREDSRLKDIEAGLKWIEENYEKQGIKSLALPALGCGLGGLPWKEVGPLMCQTLSRLSIHSTIYLPREGSITNEEKTPDFLLGRK